MHNPTNEELAKALLAYTFDTRQWPGLIDAERSLEEAQLIQDVARAESLSWQLKNSTFDDDDVFIGLDKARHVVCWHGDPAVIGLAFESPQQGAVLSCLNRSDDAALASLLCDGPQSGFFRGERLPTDARGVWLLHSPVASSSVDTALHSAGVESVLHMIPTPSQNLCREQMAEHFNITRAESRLIWQLFSAPEVKEAAEQLGVSTNTARNQLQSVYGKTGVNKQSQLLFLVAQICKRQASRPAPRSTPNQEFHLLPDGRRLAYRRYGPTQGQPLLVISSGSTGSLLPEQTYETLVLGNRQAIVPERPGFGLSDPLRPYDVRQVCADLQHLMDHLGIDRFDICGILAGASYACRLAADLEDRIGTLTLCSAIVPTRRGTNVKGVFQRFRNDLNPRLMRSAYRVLRNRLSDAMLERLIRRNVENSPGDQTYLADHPEDLNYLVAATRECAALGIDGIVDEALNLRQQAVPLSDTIRASIRVIHGEEDAIADLDAVRLYLSEQQASFTTFPEHGFLLSLRQPAALF